jgi:hypothetical protein
MKINYYLTYHAIERIQERFGSLCVKHPQLKQWKRGDDVTVAKDTIDDFVRKAEENKSFINNTKYMVFMYEKYGYNTVFKFLEYKEEDMVLVMCQVPDKNVWRLVTAMPTSYRPLATSVKFNKTDRIEVKKEKELDQWCNSLNVVAQQKIQESARNYEIADLLKDSVIAQTATVVRKVTNASKLYKTVIGETSYTFLHSTATSEPTISIQSAEPIAPTNTLMHGDIVIDMELQKRIDDQLKYALVGTVFTGEAKQVGPETQGQPGWYKVILQGVEYQFVKRKRGKRQSSEIFVLSMTNLFGAKNASN